MIYTKEDIVIYEEIKLRISEAFESDRITAQEKDRIMQALRNAVLKHDMNPRPDMDIIIEKVYEMNGIASVE